MSAILPTYARQDIEFERGEGAYLFTPAGERYLDFAGGIAVNAFGHANPALIAALTEQAGRLWHTSNLYRIPGQERLAQRLVEVSFADRVFFTNSGAEALECSIKMARRYHFGRGEPQRYRIITFAGAFHGRTLATIAAGGQAKYLEGFGPKVEGFDQVALGDHAALTAAIGPETAAILIEPIQGEGGITVVPDAELRALRALCDAHGLLLIYDEVQCGIGRTGKLFAHEWSGVTPDIMAIAKAIGGGFPLGACMATQTASAAMTAGTHGSTFGGNPLAMAVGNAVLDIVLAPGFLESVERKGLLLKKRLAELCDGFPGVIAELRGRGLMVGLKLVPPVGDMIAALRNEHLLAVGAGENVLRLLPPLTIGEAEIAQAVASIARAAAAIDPAADRAVTAPTVSAARS